MIDKIQVTFEADDEDKINFRAKLKRWLWAARICKTPALAYSELVDKKVLYNGKPANPEQIVKIGAVVEIRQGKRSRKFIVKNLSTRRHSEEKAAQLYEEVLDTNQGTIRPGSTGARVRSPFIRNRSTGAINFDEEQPLDNQNLSHLHHFMDGHSIQPYSNTRNQNYPNKNPSSQYGTGNQYTQQQQYYQKSKNEYNEDVPNLELEDQIVDDDAY